MELDTVYVLIIQHRGGSVSASVHETNLSANLRMEEFVRNTSLELPDDPGQAIQIWCDTTGGSWQVDECYIEPEEEI